MTKDIQKLLEEARQRVPGFGDQYGIKETADDYLKTQYAILYEEVPAEYTTVGERDAWVRRHEDYQAAIKRKQNAYADYKTSETYLKLLFAEVDVYRTEQANNRFIDKAHT